MRLSSYTIVTVAVMTTAVIMACTYSSGYEEADVQAKQFRLPGPEEARIAGTTERISNLERLVIGADGEEENGLVARMAALEEHLRESEKIIGAAERLLGAASVNEVGDVEFSGVNAGGLAPPAENKAFIPGCTR